MKSEPKHWAVSNYSLTHNNNHGEACDNKEETTHDCHSFQFCACLDAYCTRFALAAWSCDAACALMHVYYARTKPTRKLSRKLNGNKWKKRKSIRCTWRFGFAKCIELKADDGFTNTFNWRHHTECVWHAFISNWRLIISHINVLVPCYTEKLLWTDSASWSIEKWRISW